VGLEKDNDVHYAVVGELSQCFVGGNPSFDPPKNINIVFKMGSNDYTMNPFLGKQKNTTVWQFYLKGYTTSNKIDALMELKRIKEYNKQRPDISNIHIQEIWVPKKRNW